MQNQKVLVMLSRWWPCYVYQRQRYMHYYSAAAQKIKVLDDSALACCLSFFSFFFLDICSKHCVYTTEWLDALVKFLVSLKWPCQEITFLDNIYSTITAW